MMHWHHPKQSKTCVNSSARIEEAHCNGEMHWQMQWHRSHWARRVSIYQPVHHTHMCHSNHTHTITQIRCRLSTRQYISYHFGPFEASIYAGPHIHQHMHTCIGVCARVDAHVHGMDWLPPTFCFFSWHKYAKSTRHLTPWAALAVTSLCRLVSLFKCASMRFSRKSLARPSARLTSYAAEGWSLVGNRWWEHGPCGNRFLAMMNVNKV